MSYRAIDSAATNYTRGLTLNDKLAANQTVVDADVVRVNRLLNPAADTDLWTGAMNALLFLTGGRALGSSRLSGAVVGNGDDRPALTDSQRRRAYLAHLDAERPAYMAHLDSLRRR